MYYATGLPRWARYGRQASPDAFPAAGVESDPAFEKQVLKNQADTLRAQLDLVKKRLSDLETGAE
jgi:hypothetical protein